MAVPARNSRPYVMDWSDRIEKGLDWVSHQDGRFVLLMTPHSVRRPDGLTRRTIARVNGPSVLTLLKAYRHISRKGGAYV